MHCALFQSFPLVVLRLVPATLRHKTGRARVRMKAISVLDSGSRAIARGKDSCPSCSPQTA